MFVDVQELVWVRIADLNSHMRTLNQSHNLWLDYHEIDIVLSSPLCDSKSRDLVLKNKFMACIPDVTSRIVFEGKLSLGLDGDHHGGHGLDLGIFLDGAGRDGDPPVHLAVLLHLTSRSWGS